MNLHKSNVLLLILLLCISNLASKAQGDCCRPQVLLHCGDMFKPLACADCTEPTPCCGYGGCDIECCDCVCRVANTTTTTSTSTTCSTTEAPKTTTTTTTEAPRTTTMTTTTRTTEAPKSTTTTTQKPSTKNDSFWTLLIKHKTGKIDWWEREAERQRQSFSFEINRFFDFSALATFGILTFLLSLITIIGFLSYRLLAIRPIQNFQPREDSPLLRHEQENHHLRWAMPIG